MPKLLPISTSSFRDIIEEDKLYVDKTEYIYQLVRQKGAWFLSRPRRFGKSLFVSTLDEVYRGNRELFKGLWIDRSDYDWEPYPVIRLDFNLYPSTTAAELQSNIKRYLAQIAAQHNIALADGRIDSVVETDSYIYLFEFKLDQDAERALQQVKDHEYYRKYQLHGKPITCIGVNFNSTTRTVDDWKTLDVEPV